MFLPQDYCGQNRNVAPAPWLAFATPAVDAAFSEPPSLTNQTSSDSRGLVSSTRSAKANQCPSAAVSIDSNFDFAACAEHIILDNFSSCIRIDD